MSIYLFVYFRFECENFERFLDFVEEKPAFRISFGENPRLFRAERREVQPLARVEARRSGGRLAQR
jgi:hypothetical protein